MLFFLWHYSQYTVVLYIMSSSQSRSIYLANLRMNAGKKPAVMHILLVSSKYVIPILLEWIQVGVEVGLSYPF
uniref:VHA-A1 n=1 Tax=Arundo donax TaxID=35708 RepID=A0A0A8XNP8_ARUDO